MVRTVSFQQVPLRLRLGLMRMHCLYRLFFYFFFGGWNEVTQYQYCTIVCAAC